MLQNKNILITGGTGTFGQACVKALLWGHDSNKKIAILSRDEAKQHEMQKRWPDTHDEVSMMRYFIGDVRDKGKLALAFKGMDIVIHAAAMKQLLSCEYNPVEAVKTNILGAQNVIEAAIECGVEKVLFLSSDKAVDSVTFYGFTKAVAERLFTAANVLGICSSVVRYGNVLGSRGSVLPVFLEQKKLGHFRLTDEGMTRFWISVEDAVKFVLESLERMKGGEIFVPKMPACPIRFLVKAIAEEKDVIEITGIRAGEKVHEILVSPSEVDKAYDMGDYYIILPTVRFFGEKDWRVVQSGTTIGQIYNSRDSPWQLTVDDIRAMLKKRGLI